MPGCGFHGRTYVAGSDGSIPAYGMLPGAVTGSGSASTGYTYAFQPSLSSDDLKSMTLEFGESGNPYESDQVMVNSFTLRGDPDSDSEPGWMFEAEMMGRTISTTSYSGSITDRTTEAITARGTKLYVDTTAAGIGGTQLTGHLINWSLTGNNNIHYKAFAEDESAMAANKVGRGERTFDGEVTIEFDSDTTAIGFSKLRSGNTLYLRLEREGTTIATTYKKKLTIDCAALISSISFGDREGNMTATIGFNCFYDSTLGFDFKATVINALSSLV